MLTIVKIIKILTSKMFNECWLAWIYRSCIKSDAVEFNKLFCIFCINFCSCEETHACLKVKSEAKHNWCHTLCWFCTTVRHEHLKYVDTCWNTSTKCVYIWMTNLFLPYNPAFYKLTSTLKENHLLILIFDYAER